MMKHKVSTCAIVVAVFENIPMTLGKRWNARTYSKTLQYNGNLNYVGR